MANGTLTCTNECSGRPWQDPGAGRFPLEEPTMTDAMPSPAGAPKHRRKQVRSPEALERNRLSNRARYYAKRDDPEFKRKAYESNRDYVARNRAWLTAIKVAAGCTDCGTKDGPLDFDHRPGTIKEFNLGQPRASKERLIAEVAKCDVRCRACHSRRHGIERGGLNGC